MEVEPKALLMDGLLSVRKRKAVEVTLGFSFEQLGAWW